MAKRGRRVRRRGVATYPSTSRRLPPAISDFDDTWLNDFRERGLGSIDLESIEDRRRWHPSSTWPRSSVPPVGLRVRRPRIVIVPAGHKLARHQTYGGRYSIADVRRLRHVKASLRYGKASTWVKDRQRGPHGVHDVIRRDDLPYRVGFALPWQVVVCVRRKRRREVLHAFRIAGARGAMRRLFRKPRRNEWSEVRC